MDKLLKEAKEHGEIFEEMTLFKKSLATLSCKQAPNCLKKIKAFFATYIGGHFRFEEKKIFPQLFKICNSKEKNLIRQLQLEHIKILDKLDKMNNLLQKNKRSLGKNQVDKLLEVSKKVIALTLLHARKEDTRLFPVLKKYRIYLK